MITRTWAVGVLDVVVYATVITVWDWWAFALVVAYGLFSFWDGITR